MGELVLRSIYTLPLVLPSRTAAITEGDCLDFSRSRQRCENDIAGSGDPLRACPPMTRRSPATVLPPRVAGSCTVRSCPARSTFARHAAAHVAKSDEADVHFVLPTYFT